MQRLDAGKGIKTVLFCICLVVMIVSGYKLYEILAEYNTATEMYDNATDMAIIEAPVPSSTDVDDMPALTAPFSVDFDVLRQTNEDVVGWIYCEDTVINYPIMQGDNNTYYLEHMLDGSFNKAGSITMDCRSNAELSDVHTVLYGHNMKNGSMFTTLKKYSSQEFYDEHPIMWIFTPDETYVLELVAGYVTSADSASLDLSLNSEKMPEHIQKAIERSTFISGVPSESVSQLMTLVTCSYEYDDARYILLGSLVTLDEMNAREASAANAGNTE